MSASFPRLAAAALLFAGAITVGVAAPAFAENSPTNIPIAVDDNYTMMGGTTMTVEYADGLLVNDLHAAAWTITFVEAVQNETPGELVLESVYKNGSFTYTPDPAFSGVRTFEYQVRDGDLGVVSDNWALVTITVLDPTLPCAAGTPGCEAPDPGPGDLPCAVGTPGCIPGDLPPCDPDEVVMAPFPGDPATCIPGEPTPSDGTDLPCAVGTPGCDPTDLPPCDPNALPQAAENSVPCIPVDGGIPAPADSTSTTVPTPGTVPPGTQLETLAYTGSNTVDYRLALLAALLLASGVVMLAPRRKKA